MNAIISCEHITKKKSDFILQDISFSLGSGMILGVIGRNGCGKTTLLRTLMGSYRLWDADDHGTCRIKDKSMTDCIKDYQKQIAFVLNENPFCLEYTAAENGMLFGRYYDSFSQEKYESLLEEYQIPPKRMISELSTGEQIRQQLAFALSYEASVYFMDEPAGNLDPEFREILYSIMRQLAANGKSIIYATHLVEELEEIADEILWLHRDENTAAVKYNGTMDDLREQYALVEAEDITKIPVEIIVGGRKRELHNEVLIYKSAELPPFVREIIRYPSLKEIMYYTEKGEVV